MSAPESPVILADALHFHDGPDERLFILCGCNHVAAYHSGGSCAYNHCTCKTSRDDVFAGGRTGESS